MNLNKKFLLLGSLLASQLLFADNDSAVTIENDKNVAIVNTEFINVRTTPEIVEDNILRIIPFGTKLNIIEKVDNWLKVGDGQYIDMRLANPVEKEHLFTIEITKDLSNIRNMPNFKRSSKVGLANKGEQYEAIAIVSDWIILKNGNMIHASVARKIVNNQNLQNVTDGNEKQTNTIKLFGEKESIKRVFEKSPLADSHEVMKAIDVLQEVVIKLVEEKESTSAENTKEITRIQHQINVFQNNIEQMKRAISESKNNSDDVMDDYFMVMKTANLRQEPKEEKSNIDGFIYRGNIIKISDKMINGYFKTGNLWIHSKYITSLKEKNPIDSFVKFSNLIATDMNELREQGNETIEKISKIQQYIKEVENGNIEAKKQLENYLKQLDETTKQLNEANENIRFIQSKQNKAEENFLQIETKSKEDNLKLQKLVQADLEHNVAMEALKSKDVVVDKVIESMNGDIAISANEIKRIRSNQDNMTNTLTVFQKDVLSTEDRMQKGFSLVNTRIDNMENYFKTISSSIVSPNKPIQAIANDRLSELEEQINSLKAKQTEMEKQNIRLQEEIEVLIKLSKRK